MTVQEEELAEHSSGEGLAAEQSVVVSVRKCSLFENETHCSSYRLFFGKIGLSLQGNTKK